MIVITLTTGTIFVMWLGEQITERGVGNGISLLIFAGIVIGLPRGLAQVSDRVRGGDWTSDTRCCYSWSLLGRA